MANRLFQLGNLSIAVVGLLCLLTLAAWTVPGVEAMLPSAWANMAFNTALCLLLLCICLLSTHLQPSLLRMILRYVCTLLPVLLALAHLTPGLREHAVSLGNLPIHTSVVSVRASMSLQTALCVLWMGLSLNIKTTAQQVQGWILDSLILLLVVTDLVLLAASFFKGPGSSELINTISISMQSLFSIVILSLVIISRRLPFSAFAVIANDSIGGYFARVMLPVSVVIAYLIVYLSNQLLLRGILSEAYALGFISAVQGTLLILVVLILARRIQVLESNLHDISITDELTGIYNRRGLHTHGKQAWRDATHSGHPLAVLFFDIDQLKLINDTLGHDVGSRLILDMATLMKKCFRTDDIIGRLGGDEFVVIAPGHLEELAPALECLRQATHDLNALGHNPYHISFSVGGVLLDKEARESFEHLLARADAAMYEDKRSKQAIREQDTSHACSLSATRPL